MDSEIVYDERGLVPCVVQDWNSGEVLTLAYMNATALARTRATGELHLWSRSRDELWHKGATSGNTQAVRALRLDCDGDAVLALVEPAGPACHTGERTLLSPRRARAAGAARGAAGARAHARRRARPSAPPAPTPSSCSTIRTRWREGDGGGRGGRASGARGERRARRRGGGRRALPPARAARRARAAARATSSGCSMSRRR